MTVFEFRRSSD